MSTLSAFDCLDEEDADADSVISSSLLDESDGSDDSDPDEPAAVEPIAQDVASNNKKQRSIGRTVSRSYTDADAGEWVVSPAALKALTAASAASVTLERFHANKWRELFRLHALLQAPTFRGVRLAGGDRALFETFARSFPHDLVPKPRFTSVLRAALGIRHDLDLRVGRAGPDAAHADQAAFARHLDALKSCCERGHDDVEALHWRSLLVALRMFREPLLPMREQLQWAFAVFASRDGYLDLGRGAGKSTRASAGPAAALGDVFLLATHALRSPAAAAFVADRIRAALATLPTPPLSLSTRVSRRQFMALLESAPLRGLLAHGAADRPHTSVMDELSARVYRDHVARARRREHNLRAVQCLRFTFATRALRSSFRGWAELARRNSSVRLAALRSGRVLARGRCRHAFLALKRHCMASIAAVEIQRLARGVRGRAAASDQFARVQAALKVQGAFRMRSHLSRFLRELRRRHALAVRIQRAFRGRQGRVLARQALLALYAREMAALAVERRAFYAMVRDSLARRIQRAARAFLGERLEQRRREEASAIRRLEQEMLESAMFGSREAQRHRLEVAAAFESQRLEAQARERRREVDALEKQKIVRRRREREWEALREARVARREQLKAAAEGAYEALKADWQHRIEQRADERQRLVTQVLALESTAGPEWRELQRSLRQRVVARAKELSAKLREARANVSDREAQQRAQREVVGEEADTARQQATEEWLAAEAAFLRELDEQEEQRSLQENAAARVARERGAVMIQCAFRRFAARKLLRDQVRALFVKEFDPQTRAAQYRNTFNGEIKPKKPRALGSEDLQFVDRWFQLRDEEIDEVFYYHPRSMRQSWELPTECRLCDTHPESPAVFADFWNTDAGVFVCQSCYDRQRRASDGASQSFVRYDGARRDGGASNVGGAPL